MTKTIAPAARALTLCIAASLGFQAANVSAADVSNEQSMKNGSRNYVVRFSDVDVSNIMGVKVLYLRLRYAARVVCQPFESASSWGTTQYEDCMQKAISDAVANVNRPLLSQYHQSRTKSEKTGQVRFATAN